MSPELPLDQLLLQLENPSGPLIAPSARAAAFLRAAFDRRQQAAGRTVWTPPPILSWQQWLSSLWTRLLLDGHDDRLLLNSAQEALLWRDLIAADRDLPALSSPESLASLAQSAFALAAAFRTETRLRRATAGPDARIFAAWADAFTRTCASSHYLPAAQLELALETHLCAGHFPPPPHLTLHGLLDPTPTQSAFMATLEESGVTLSRLTAQGSKLSDNPPASAAQHATITFPTETAEQRAAIFFLRDRLLAGQRCALIVPDPAAERARLEPDLRDLLAPELNDIASTAAEPWTFSSPGPFAALPAIAAALDLLRWLDAPLSLSRISALVLSPHFAAALALADRTRFDAALHATTLLRPELSIAATLAFAHSQHPAIAAALEPIHALALRLNGTPPRRTFSTWTESFREALRAAQWPAESLHTDAADALDAVLDLVATLDFAGRRCTLSEAVAAIERQAQQSPAPGNSAAPLHILTLDEAAAIPFDTAIVLRATDANYPPRPRPHPLLDFQLQRDLRMPGTSAEADHARFLAAAQQLAAACGSLILFSAQEDASGPLRPAAFGRALGPQPLDPHTFPQPTPPHPPLPLETFADTAPLPPPATKVPGGARVLQLQAACGFLAFAEIRLASAEPRTAQAGLDPLESGRFLHATLEAFWKAIGSQQNLRALTPDARRDAIQQAIDAAFRLRPQDAWDAAFLDVLRARMARLLNDWLDFELERAPFTVLETEYKHPITVGPLELDVRLDRIDRIGEGESAGFVVVDYKTGARISPAAWDGDRPDEPQLPLYTLAGDSERLLGLAFARLRAGKEMGWAGFARAGLFAARAVKPEDLQLRSEAWRSILEALATDFYNGANAVSPKEYARNCKHCAQRLLCRLDLASLMAQPDAETAETADV